jgi:hypothetical protein
MKKTILLFFLILNIHAISQSITFNNIYNPYNKNIFSIGAGIQKKGNGYITLASTGDTLISFKRNILFNEIDSFGNLTKITTFARDSFDMYGGGYGALIQTSDGGYFIPCSIVYNDTNMDHYLIRFDANMDTLWTKTIDHGTIWENYYQPCETYDKGFACVGLRVITSTLYDVLLAKFDSLGNKLWEKTISLGNYSVGGEIKETPDNGFLICGYRSSNADYSGDPFVIKTDSAGNVKWYRILGAPNQNDGGASIAITSQGDYIVAYGNTTYTYPWPDNDYYHGQLNVLKLNSNGYTIWSRLYDTVKVKIVVNKIQVLPNDNFIVMGHNIEKDYFYFFGSFLFKFNTNGDSLCRRIYSYSTDDYDGNLLKDNILNPDGSITAIGMLIADTMNPRQRIWMVKTDTNLYAPGCYPTGVEENITQKDGSISIFPNPVADDNLTITYSFSDIYNEIHLFINDASGSLVYQSNLNNTKGQHKLSVKDLASGSYICSFYHKDKLLNSVKFIKK